MSSHPLSPDNAKKAFHSPSQLATKRLGKRVASPPHGHAPLSPASSDISMSSSSSRRSQSLIVGKHEAEIFEQMRDANTAVVSKKKKNKVRPQKSPLSSPITSPVMSPVDDLMRSAQGSFDSLRQQAELVLNQLSPGSGSFLRDKPEPPPPNIFPRQGPYVPGLSPALSVPSLSLSHHGSASFDKTTTPVVSFERENDQQEFRKTPTQQHQQSAREDSDEGLEEDEDDDAEMPATTTRHNKHVPSMMTRSEEELHAIQLPMIREVSYDPVRAARNDDNESLGDDEEIIVKLDKHDEVDEEEQDFAPEHDPIESMRSEIAEEDGDDTVTSDAKYELQEDTPTSRDWDKLDDFVVASAPRVPEQDSAVANSSPPAIAAPTPVIVKNDSLDEVMQGDESETGEARIAATPQQAMERQVVENDEGTADAEVTAAARRPRKEDDPSAASRTPFSDATDDMRSTPVLSYGTNMGISFGVGATQTEDAVENVRYHATAGPVVTENASETSSQQKTKLDLKNNDNSFYVLANLLVDFFYPKVNVATGEILLQPGDRDQVERMLPRSARLAFIAALRHRLHNIRGAAPSSSLEHLAVQCQQLGLDREGADNPILCAMALTTNPVLVRVMPAPPVVAPTTQAPQQALPATAAAPSPSGQSAFAAAPSNTTTSSQQQPSPAPTPKATTTASKEADEILIDMNSATGYMARQQLLAELREASKLMEESVTPETAAFWRDHVLNLQARLRALLGEGGGGGGTTTPDECQLSAADDGDDAADTSSKEQYTPPPLESKGSAQSRSSKRSGVAPSPSLARDEPPGTPQKQQAGRNDHGPDYQAFEDEEEAPLVDVVAPADLPGGYHFEAEIEGQRFLATVPAGGVKQGETFTCCMRELDSVAIDIPVGYWKDNLSDCYRYGCCHPVFWNGIVCPLVALGQIATRVNLDFLGRPKVFDDGVPNRTVLLTILIGWALINLSLFGGYNLKWSQGLELCVADWLALVLVNGVMFSFIVFVTQSVRNSVREKFMIREQRCYDLEDLCCAVWCLPCTVCQMSRHTANYDDYEAVCCSKNGLPDGVRVNQPPSSSKEVDQYIV